MDEARASYANGSAGGEWTAASLGRDRFCRWLVVGLLLAWLPLWLPQLPEEAVAFYSRHIITVPFLLLAIHAMQQRAQGSTWSTDRWFWRLLCLGFSGWLLAGVIHPFVDALIAPEGEVHDLTLHLPHMLFYGALIIGLEIQPCTRRDAVPQRLRGLSWAGSFVLVMTLLLYFLVLPDLAQGSPPDVWLYNQALFVALDAYLLLRLWHLKTSALGPQWRILYSCLLAGTAIWTAVDLLSLAMAQGAIPSPGWGTPLDILGPAAFVAVAFAARVPKPDEESQAFSHHPHRPLGMGPLPLFVICPLLLHVGLHHFNEGDPALVELRAALALGSTVVLAAMTLFYHYFLRQENEQLVSEEIRTRDELVFQALHDELTGLPNRNLFRDRLQVALADAARQDSRCAILFCDLDNFKVINDSLGHEAGDRVLVWAARRLRETVRECDTVARLGGDEFAIVIPGIREALDGAGLARKVLEQIGEPMCIDGKSHTLNTSIGVAVFPDDGRDEETLLKHADTAMYQAKLHGRNQYRLFTQAMNEAAEERLAIEQGLRTGLLEDRFQLFYQPVVSLLTGKVTCYEALLRWNHPERGYIKPVNFIDVAEQTGLIVELGQWVLETACRWVASQPSDGITPAVSVNVSQRQLRAPGFGQQVRRTLERTGLAPERLHLEIRESKALASPYTRDTLSELRDIGVRIAIDDFGTGYSALCRLEELPLDIVKIDRSFVSGASRGSVSEAVISAVVNMARALDFSVVAEGVETAEEFDLVRRLSCDGVQGYLICDPRPAEAFEDGEQEAGFRPNLYALEPQRDRGWGSPSNTVPQTGMSRSASGATS